MVSKTKSAKETNNRPPVFVVLQLSGGNDFMSTVIPYNDPHYFEYRKTVGIPEDDALHIDGGYAFHPSMGSIKNLWDEGKVAIFPGTGYPSPNRSHFRSMDIWHTANPEALSSDGWLGKTIRDLDPQKENVVTGVSFGSGLPRAMYLSGTPAISVSELEGYGLLTDLAGRQQRQAIKAFTRMYAPEEFEEADVVWDHLGQTGIDALTGADMLKTAPPAYTSSVEYANDALSQSLKGIAQVHLSGIGTRIFYAQLGGFDVHGAQIQTQQTLLQNVSRSVGDFFDDLRENDGSQEVIMMIFSEFGRRIKDNGNGTDHGSGGGTLLIGDRVKGGFYDPYPSLAPEDQLDGDMHFSHDFRSIYSTVLEQWLGLNPVPIVNGAFDQFENVFNL
ncbi:MAG: DUF1501 domain-containing protein [SAR202 cluster bacterium]|jgi:uncharacterized protein (DUF1501 family)|nr:DUF1501 domain-containing protein [SAR202 cluster bacterium]MED5428392.1 DUF1501 domain-containing protein [Chloroflexota bacterium]MQG74360.1 DUF1501 domain-containing protein [SAR202 cluster bacterium]|tara:strand:+ start:4797 stop:5960 length:1164 start_codon:yes stop_codon:yes gene_type:complete